MELSTITMMTSENNETIGRCALFDGNEYKCNVILAVRKFVGCLSLIGCLFMMVIIWLFRKYNLFAQRLILYLTIAAFFSSISFLMQRDRADGPVCNFEGFWVTLWDWSILLWTCCITFNLMMSVARMTSTEKYEIIYHVVGWGIPLFLSSLPFIGDHYGPAGAWCWITDEYMDGTRWRFGIWYGPLFVIIVLMFICYIYVLYTLKKMIGVYQGTQEPQMQHAERDRRMLKKEIKPLVAYPCVYLVLSIFALINRIHNAIAPDDPIFALVLLQGMTSPLVGAVNALVYGLDRTTRRKLNKRSIKKAFDRKKEHSSGVIQEYNPPPPVTSSKESNDDKNVEVDKPGQNVPQMPVTSKQTTESNENKHSRADSSGSDPAQSPRTSGNDNTHVDGGNSVSNDDTHVAGDNAGSDSSQSPATSNTESNDITNTV